ncbi:MAG: LytTR family DNA-binding domain-containing protein [Cellulophaga sp.]
MKLRSVLVDDSSTQRKLVSSLIQKHTQLALIAEYSNPLDAKKYLIEGASIDLIFLDVEMPTINGFELLDSLENPPQIILISGNANYALRAFDYDILDFLHKPIAKNRFNISIDRAITQYKHMENANNNENYILVKTDFMNRKIFINNIKWIEALGDYIKIVTDSKNILVLSTMKAIINELPTGKFLRIHKSYIVNLNRVDNFGSKFIEIDGGKIPISARNKEALKEAFAV